MPNNLRVLDAARTVADDINSIIGRSKPRILHDAQILGAAESVTANIREAYGRRRGPERNQFFRFARGSAEETDEHLRSNFAANRLPAALYWRLHNRLAVIVRMLNALMAD